MAKETTELVLPSGRKLQVQSSAVREKGLAPAAKGPETIGLELGVKLGGKTGIILAEGTAEANLKLTLTWKNP